MPSTEHDRLTAKHGALLVIDVQEKLLRAIEGRDRLLTNTLRLVKAAKLLDIPVFATEQYPKGLGPTVTELAELIPDRPTKTTFHALGALGIAESLTSRSIRHVTLVGIEAHVCVAQTSLELLRLGYQVQVLADAIGSRFVIDRQYALRRIEQAGAVVSTTEAALFEWVGGAEHPRFKEISALVKERTAE